MAVMSKVYDIDKFPEQMSTSLAAKYMGKTPQAVRMDIKLGRLEAKRVGRNYKITRAAIKKMYGL